MLKSFAQPGLALVAGRHGDDSGLLIPQAETEETIAFVLVLRCGADHRVCLEVAPDMHDVFIVVAFISIVLSPSVAAMGVFKEGRDRS